MTAGRDIFQYFRLPYYFYPSSFLAGLKFYLGFLHSSDKKKHLPYQLHVVLSRTLDMLYEIYSR